MADFDLAFDKVMRREGGYANDPNDFGRETYRGISRRYHPNWSGWAIIDAAKAHPRFPVCLEVNHELQIAVRALYRNEYWNRVRGSFLESQKLADELLDIAVSLGPDRAVMFLQRGLNLLNGQQKLWPDLVVDGVLGEITTQSLMRCSSMRPIRYLLTVLNIFQGAHYVSRMEANESQERFIGWLDRVELMHR